MGFIDHLIFLNRPDSLYYVVLAQISLCYSLLLDGFIHIIHPFATKSR